MIKAFFFFFTDYLLPSDSVSRLACSATQTQNALFLATDKIFSWKLLICMNKQFLTSIDNISAPALIPPNQAIKFNYPHIFHNLNF